MHALDDSTSTGHALAASREPRNGTTRYMTVHDKKTEAGGGGDTIRYNRPYSTFAQKLTTRPSDGIDFSQFLKCNSSRNAAVIGCSSGQM